MYRFIDCILLNCFSSIYLVLLCIEFELLTLLWYYQSQFYLSLISFGYVKQKCGLLLCIIYFQKANESIKRVSSSARDEIRPSFQTDGQNLSLHLLSVLSSTRDKTRLWEEMSALNEEVKTSLLFKLMPFRKRQVESIPFKRCQLYVDEQNFVSLHLKLMSVAKGDFFLLQIGDYSTQADKFRPFLEMMEQMKTPIV